MTRVTPDQAYIVWRDLGRKRSAAATARVFDAKGVRISDESIRRWAHQHGWEARLLMEGIGEQVARVEIRVGLDELQSSVDALEALNTAVIDAARRASQAVRSVEVNTVADVARLYEVAADTARASAQTRDTLVRLVPLLKGETGETADPAAPDVTQARPSGGVIDLGDVRRLLGRGSA